MDLEDLSPVFLRYKKEVLSGELSVAVFINSPIPNYLKLVFTEYHCGSSLLLLDRGRKEFLLNQLIGLAADPLPDLDNGSGLLFVLYVYCFK